MRTSPLVSGTSIAVSLSLVSPVSGQSIPGASFLFGNGAPGAGQYRLVDNYDGASNFFDKFNYFTSADPTYGHVQYVNESVAQQNQHAAISSDGTAIIRVDSTNVWLRGGPGRPSVRLMSDNTYSHGLFIVDLLHMPWGCSVWPALWLLRPDWPNNGETGIIEGVNTVRKDTVTLHASAGCTIAGSGQSGTLQTNDCSGGYGSILTNKETPNNYSTNLNTNGGGVYATEWTSDYIKTWFFPRKRIPASIVSGSPNPSTDFGTPAVNQQGSCLIDDHFSNMSIVINTDFCGEWAGAVYQKEFSSCPQTIGANSLDSCIDFADNNASYFADAY